MNNSIEKENSLEKGDNVSNISEMVSPAIDYKNCSWQKTAGLLFSEYICLAIMSFPNSYAVLGLIPGLLITVFVSLLVFYTGLIITDYSIANPGVTSVCDIGKNLFWNSNVVWYCTAACFIGNNTIIQALHVLVGAKYFNTIADNYEGGRIDVCSIAFAVVSMVICCLLSLPRTFSHMSFIGYFSAATMFVSVILSMTFAGVQSHPPKWTGDEITWNLWPKEGTMYVEGMTAMLNIVYTFCGQICYPSFISQMTRPKDFKKALSVVTILELITFALCGSIVYVYVGNEYITAPAFGSLVGNYKKIAFSFALPTVLFLGSLYSNVTAQFFFLHIFKEGSAHREDHTVKGWTTWVGINVGLWVLAFVIAEVIPFFSDLLSLMSSLFDCWFGFVFWGVAYFRLLQYKDPNFTFWSAFKEGSILKKLSMIWNILLIIMGLYILGPGLYATCQSIINSYKSGLYGNPFTCVSNAL